MVTQMDSVRLRNLRLDLLMAKVKRMDLQTGWQMVKVKRMVIMMGLLIRLH